MSFAIRDGCLGLHADTVDSAARRLNAGIAVSYLVRTPRCEVGTVRSLRRPSPRSAG